LLFFLSIIKGRLFPFPPPLTSARGRHAQVVGLIRPSPDPGPFPSSLNGRIRESWCQIKSRPCVVYDPLRRHSPPFLFSFFFFFPFFPNDGADWRAAGSPRPDRVLFFFRRTSFGGMRKSGGETGDLDCTSFLLLPTESPFPLFLPSPYTKTEVCNSPPFRGRHQAKPGEVTDPAAPFLFFLFLLFSFLPREQEKRRDAGDFAQRQFLFLFLFPPPVSAHPPGCSTGMDRPMPCTRAKGAFTVRLPPSSFFFSPPEWPSSSREAVCEIHLSTASPPFSLLLSS